MDGLQIFLLILLGVASLSYDGISGSVEVTIRPGDNITLYCDCKTSSGEYIVWYRNCSHENQPSLVLKVRDPWSQGINVGRWMNPLPRFHFVKNKSSDSYDLLIMNTTESDEGIYYCGTEQVKVEDKEIITSTYVYRYGNITTRIIFNSSGCISSPDSSGCISSPVPVVSWMMVFTPAFTILSAFLSFILVYHFCQKTDKEPQILQINPDTRGQTKQNKDEDLCLSRVVFRAKDGQIHQ